MFCSPLPIDYIDIVDTTGAIIMCFLVQIKYIGQTHTAQDGSSLDMAPSTTMAAKGVRPHLDNLKDKVKHQTQREGVSRVFL